jgi:hypothetical protein
VYSYRLHDDGDLMWTWHIVGHGVSIGSILIAGISPWSTYKQAAAECASQCARCGGSRVVGGGPRFGGFHRDNLAPLGFGGREDLRLCGCCHLDGLWGRLVGPEEILACLRIEPQGFDCGYRGDSPDRAVCVDLQRS